ncbi:type II secretion system protein GspK [Pokkaliibacter sp. MBI-7]|uniref:general secretion pathway protein GspK n=1 Tax=Pokkaliibacter sp. MBI-7 TaxID=3040600 RepID=UPI00244C0242|nr:type II secretion system protein GspK [Pokkaliibacter sp. MBI-7]MDH2431071.1 type II secretion system protein GspK [Pokkaliibacter sp. MBI-7]
MNNAGIRIQQRGVALILVLWIAALLTVVVTAMLSVTRTSQRLQSYQLQHTQAVLLAQAGVEQVVATLLQAADGAGPWQANGQPYTISIDQQPLEIRLYSDLGKVDINVAGTELLTALFAAVGADSGLAQRLAAELLDWRDADDQPRPNGAEASDYLASGRLSVPRNQSFRSIVELHQLRSMTPQLFLQLEPLVTIWTGQEVPRLKLAAPAVATALQRTQGTQLSNLASAPGNVLTIISQAQMASGALAGVVETLILDAGGGRQGRPYRLLYLREF